MSLLETLFGGTVVVVILHWLLGRLGLANYWRGVISGAIPTIAYALYAIMAGDGLDVIAIHVAIFLAAATVLSLLASDKKNNSRRTLHWVPKALIVFFVLLFVVDAAFVSIASQGVPPWLASLVLPRAKEQPVYTGFSGVTEHNQAAAKAVSQQLKKRSDEQRLGWDVELTGLSALVAGEKGASKLTLRLHDSKKQPIQNAVVTLDIFRPGNVETLAQLRLQQDKPGEYSSAVRIPHPGFWVVKLIIEADGNRIVREHDVNVSAS